MNTSSKENVDSSDNESKTKSTNRGKKRKRKSSSDSSSNDGDDLPDNMLLVENKVHASAVKNNLDDISVRKILKKVVTNDHVLALVKLREEEEEAIKGKDDKKVTPKLTRAKVRELMKVAPKSTWNLENLELTPIKHIPVKTRPEVKALIAQELQEDEDDDEYEPTNDEVPSDDDQTLESCSDMESQPRTPATPINNNEASPKILKDGPFKVPQEPSSCVKRKLNMEEEATIALRTRSKLSLSSTSIEHIESTFVPPDDIPVGDVDDLWNQFLTECLDPGSTSKNEDDDEADPEYNVAADADTHDEDEEALSSSIIKISKKELNDLVTELFSILPDATVSEDLAENLANTVLTDNNQSEITQWEGKQEPVSDEEQRSMSERIIFEKSSYTRLSIGKIEIPENTEYKDLENGGGCATGRGQDNRIGKEMGGTDHRMSRSIANDKSVNMCIEEINTQVSISTNIGEAPHLLKVLSIPQRTQHNLELQVNSGIVMTAEQISILQQQLRQHVQLATTNFLQLYVHPLFWTYAPPYKKYLESLVELGKIKPKSVVNVCNLNPALELVNLWESTVSADTDENTEMVKFIQNEIDRNRRSSIHNHPYVGNFPELFKELVANSTVFLYPHLLPPIPYRADQDRKRASYLLSEDALIILGLDQFCDYVEANPELTKGRSKHSRHRPMLGITVQLMVKHMFPWMTAKMIMSHIHNIIKKGFKIHPIKKFFKNRELVPVQHVLLPFNPSLTLYEQPESEMPRLWLRHLAKHSKRFRNHLRYKTRSCNKPQGVPVYLNQTPVSQNKTTLPTDFVKEITKPNYNIDETEQAVTQCSTNQNDDNNSNEIIDKIVLGTNSTCLSINGSSITVIVTPLTPSTQTNTVSSINRPIITPAEVNFVTTSSRNNLTTETSNGNSSNVNLKHCSCCTLLNKISKRQTTILEHFKAKKRSCYCSEIKYPKISNRLKLLVNNYKNDFEVDYKELDRKLKMLKNDVKLDSNEANATVDLDELVYVTTFQLRLTIRTAVSRNQYLKKRIKKVFSTFNVDSCDVMKLAKQIGDSMFNEELVDLYKDFLGFLTPEQADKMNSFKDYFVRGCVRNLVRRIEEEVKQKHDLVSILSTLQEMFTDNESTACGMCTKLLSTMKDYPRLAKHVFSLFPHRREERYPNREIVRPPPFTNNCKLQTQNGEQNVEEQHERNVIDYEADHSSSVSELEEEEMNNVRAIVNVEDGGNRFILNPLQINERINSIDEKPNTDDNDSDVSLKIVSESEEEIKEEMSDWTREEDKLILEFLNQLLTPKEKQNNTIMEMFEENNVFEPLTETLVHKSERDIKDRVMYLLKFLVPCNDE